MPFGSLWAPYEGSVTPFDPVWTTFRPLLVPFGSIWLNMAPSCLNMAPSGSIWPNMEPLNGIDGPIMAANMEPYGAPIVPKRAMGNVDGPFGHGNQLCQYKGPI